MASLRRKLLRLLLDPKRKVRTCAQHSSSGHLRFFLRSQLSCRPRRTRKAEAVTALADRILPVTVRVLIRTARVPPATRQHITAPARVVQRTAKSSSPRLLPRARPMPNPSPRMQRRQLAITVAPIGPRLACSVTRAARSPAAGGQEPNSRSLIRVLRPVDRREDAPATSSIT